MKTSKTTSLIIMLIALLTSFSACKKDKNDANNSAGNGSSYEFSGKKYNITSVEEKHIDTDIYLEFDAGLSGDAFQVVLANTASLPIGLLSYNSNRFGANYDPLSNFWTGVVVVGGANTSVTGGTINIAPNGDGYKITFNVTTANGKITGEYNGKPTKI